jgi:hypothetical protein
MRPTRITGYVDEHGEIHEGVVPVLCGTKISSPYGASWMQMNQDFLLEFSARRDLGLNVHRVFTYLNARLDFENIILVPQIEIAEHLGMPRQSVYRALKKLETIGVIIRGPKVCRSSSWRLNPNAGWKGKITHLRVAQRDHLRLIKNQRTRLTDE